MCTIKRVGRWGDFSPSAFYLLTIINDQPLFLTKVFRKHRCLTAVLQYLKIPKCCSDFLHKNLELACARACWGKGSAADVQESSVQDVFLHPSIYFPLPLASPSPLPARPGFCSGLIFPSFLHPHPAQATGASLCPARLPRVRPAGCPCARLPSPPLPPIAASRPRAAGGLMVLVISALDH